VIQLPGKKALPVKDILNGRSEWFSVGSHINTLVKDTKTNKELS
jgi:methionyl-tRNA formyltransferase